MKKISFIAFLLVIVTLLSSTTLVSAKTKKSSSNIKKLTVKPASQGFLYVTWKQSKKVTKTDIYISTNKKKWTKAVNEISEKKIFKYEEAKNAYLVGVLKPDRKYYVKVKPYIGKKGKKAVIKSAKTYKKFTGQASDVKAKISDKGVNVTWNNSKEKRDEIYVFRLVYDRNEQSYVVDKDVDEGFVGANPVGKNTNSFTDSVPLRNGCKYRWVVCYELNRKPYYKNGDEESFIREQGPLVKSNSIKYKELIN